MWTFAHNPFLGPDEVRANIRSFDFCREAASMKTSSITEKRIYGEAW
jgi:hypothetical protein